MQFTVCRQYPVCLPVFVELLAIIGRCCVSILIFNRGYSQNPYYLILKPPTCLRRLIVYRESPLCAVPL